MYISVKDLIKDSDSLRAGVATLDRPGPAIALAVDADGRYRGVVDPDSIERAIAAGHSPDAPLAAAIRADGALPASADRADLDRRLAESGFLPLLDPNGRPAELASPAGKRRIPVAEPSLSGNELKYVTECIETGWISSQGGFVKRFEAEIGKRLGIEHVVAVSNGTVALHLALVALGIGPGHEVLVPNLTFAATINTVIQAGATPVIVDVDPRSWNMDPAAAAAAVTSRTKAIMPVHLYGQPAEMDALLALAERYDLVVIEDAAEAMGSAYKGKPCGAIGHAGTFSFFSNKLITTGEGGAVAFRDAAVAQRARRLRDHGMDPAKRYWHAEVGYNYRLTNLQSAVGCAQLERLDDFLAAKLDIAKRYGAKLGKIGGLTIPAVIPGLLNSYWAYSVIGDFASLGISRDEFMGRLDKAGIETRPLFYPLHVMPPYRAFAGNRSFPVTDKLSDGGISLPSAVTLGAAETAYISGVIERQFAARRLARRIGAA
ncbi:MAG: aminotransferase class I/II-fold pyridoxal phosphate-dependent enzyme [Alphaproteobacteria bacterium]|nr:aminotransferase class I/II-fold pyridoxal phosphate-dependent enzyme [Alphaproteobacteria bacterium]